MIANAVLFGLLMECLLNLLSFAMAISLDSAPVYSRFVLFCCILGVVALLGIVGLIFANISLFEKLEYTKKSWCIQYVGALILSAPMIKAWETAFDLFQGGL